MAIVDGFMTELEHEIKATRPMLERLPDDKLDWRPHPKSMTLGRLASHVAELHGWLATTIAQDELDLEQAGYTEWVCRDRDDLLKTFDETTARALESMRGLDDAAMAREWTIRRGERVILKMPRTGVYRFLILNHLIHHRAQLGVYYRLLDVPLPSIYGPSADEKMK